MLIAALIASGIAWGITLPLTVIAVSTGHGTFGLVFWQQLILSVVLCAIVYGRGGRLVWGRAQVVRYGVIALVGTVLPNMASYEAARHLPAGILSILLSTIPMMALPIAWALGLERPELRRIVGIALGFVAVLLIVGPDASLPDRSLLVFIPLALVAPAFYAFEGNFVAKWGTAGLDAVQVLAGASVVGVMLVTPLMLVSGQWVAPALGKPEMALVGSSLAHCAAYVAYVWLVGRAGSIFTAQVSYVVTGAGVVWAMILLGERFGWTVWVAFAVMMVGLALVQPRRAR